jgi:hypothetical protein
MFQEFYDKNQNHVSLSSSHLIYVQGKGYIKAAHVQIGDKLRVFGAKQSRFVDFEVKRIDFQVKVGYVAPLTREGTLLVNQVDTSCFAEVNDHNIANWAMTPLKVWYSISKYLTLSSQQPHANHFETENREISAYSLFLHKIATNLFPSYLV